VPAGAVRRFDRPVEDGDVLVRNHFGGRAPVVDRVVTHDLQEIRQNASDGPAPPRIARSVEVNASAAKSSRSDWATSMAAVARNAEAACVRYSAPCVRAVAVSEVLVRLHAVSHGRRLLITHHWCACSGRPGGGLHGENRGCGATSRRRSK